MPPLVDQAMALAAAFGAVGRVLARGFPAQRRRTRAASDGLPGPLHAPPPRIAAHHTPKQAGKAPALVPGLEAVMEDAAGDAEPGAVDGLPLAAGPQDVPAAVADGARIGGRAGPRLVGGLGQARLKRRPTGRGTRK